MWTADYSNPAKSNYLVIDGHQIQLPIPPSKREIDNYKLSINNQKFRREEIPSDIGMWDQKKLEGFIDMMFHYREHGKWIYLKGNPVYINGWAWEYYNFWTTEAGGRPDFRWEGVEFFTYFDDKWRDENCYGVLDIKGRRIGDTDKSVFLAWSIATRYRNAWSGHQNIDKEAAKENFLRITTAHNSMPFFMKPIMKGGSDPQKVMLFDYPEEYVSMKRLKEQKEAKSRGEDVISELPTYAPLKSRVDYETTVLGKYDGKRLAFYYMDEPGKITAFNPVEQWEVVKPALAVFNGKKIVGFGMFTTTVEDFQDGQTLRNVKDLWDKSDPTELNANGRTVSGLHRIFRDATLTGEPDEWGFPNREEAITLIENEKASLEAIGDFDGLDSFARKHPLCIDDVFKLPHDECTLYPVLLDRRIQQIKDNVCPATNSSTDPDGRIIRPKTVKGDLHWKRGQFGADVEWRPTPNGRWEISQLPTTPNNKKKNGNHQFPGNDEEFTFGVDPVDHMIEAQIKKSEKGKRHKDTSFAAGAVFRRYNHMIDGDLSRDENGDISKQDIWKMKTDQYVCDYQYRTRDPYEFYEDMLKTSIFYGVKMFAERNKPGVINFFYQKGFRGYLKNKPQATNVDPTKRSKANDNKGGDATTNTIKLYIDALQWHVLSRIDNYHHQRILACHRQFNTDNRTKRDLTVACGFSQLADLDSKRNKIEEKRTQWDKPIFELKKRRL